MIQTKKIAHELYLKQLFELLSIKSISTLPSHKKDILKATSWLKDYLKDIGFNDTKELYASGMSQKTHHPVLYTSRIENKDNPTLLLYGHYDVQPADPLDEWKSDPFTPDVRDGNIYARGATDDKGQFFTHLAAIHTLASKWGKDWPLNIKILLEGEEEAGSQNINKLISENKDTGLFDADVCVLSDTGFIDESHPTLHYGLRGWVGFQINVLLAENDSHSGRFGGGVLNPVLALSYILSCLYNIETGKVSIPGFYDDVLPLDASEKEHLATLPYSEEEFLSQAGNAKATFGEKKYTTHERTRGRPSLDVTGIWGGFTENGNKSIVPATAHAKILIRTVPQQNTEQIMEQAISYIESITPREVMVSVEKFQTGEGVLLDTNSPMMKMAERALKETFGKNPVFVRSGGSIPVVSHITNTLGIETIMMGYGLPDDNLHAPNEKFSLEQFYKGIENNIRFYEMVVKNK